MPLWLLLGGQAAKSKRAGGRQTNKQIDGGGLAGLTSGQGWTVDELAVQARADKLGRRADKSGRGDRGVEGRTSGRG